MNMLRSASGTPLLIFAGDPSPEWIAKYCVNGNWLDKCEGDRTVPASVVAQALKALEIARDLARDSVCRFEADYTKEFSPDLAEHARNRVSFIEQVSEALKKCY